MFTRTCRHLKRGSGKMNMKGVQQHSMKQFEKSDKLHPITQQAKRIGNCTSFVKGLFLETFPFNFFREIIDRRFKNRLRLNVWCLSSKQSVGVERHEMWVRPRLRFEVYFGPRESPEYKYIPHSCNTKICLVPTDELVRNNLILEKVSGCPTSQRLYFSKS